MPWTKLNIDRRELLLANLLKYSRNEILNKSKYGSAEKGEQHISALLKMTVNQFIAEGINESGTRVDYQLIAESNAYQQFCEHHTPQLCHFDPNILTNRAERLAFWINLYNVLVIDAVIRFKVEKSVTDGFFGILKFFRQAAYQIHGQRVSLEDIEHGILRRNRGNPYIPGPQFGIGDKRIAWIITPVEPRIHFAINCASRSCPPINVYDPKFIDSQLNIAASNFINQETQVDARLQTITTSQIFNWFKDDFGGRKEIINFIHQYLPQDHAATEALESGKYKFKYQPYDWHINI